MGPTGDWQPIAGHWTAEPDVLWNSNFRLGSPLRTLMDARTAPGRAPRGHVRWQTSDIATNRAYDSTIPGTMPMVCGPGNRYLPTALWGTLKQETGR